jgi:signal transduction histidine kinase
MKFSDSGTGIPKDLQEKIFNAFFTTKGRGVGSGLGLSLCKKILEDHSGGLAIDNTQLHTTFIITLKKS